MNRFFYILLAVFVFTSCQNKHHDDHHSETESEATHADTNHSDPVLVGPSDEPPMYSKKFMEAFKQSDELSGATLLGKFMIIDEDTIPFPADPPLGEQHILTGKQGEMSITLTLDRINQSTILYKIEMAVTGKESYTSKGEAHISPLFYLAGEMDESSISGISYGAIQFDDANGECYTSIRIGREEESGAGLLGKLIKNCNGELGDVELEDFPTLVEK